LGRVNAVFYALNIDILIVLKTNIKLSTKMA